MRKWILIYALLGCNFAYSQKCEWQQHVDYKMEVSLDTELHRITGNQKLTYTNNSPDTLRKVFYHLYFNAFQPGSSMDVRSRSLPDPDPRVGSRIAALKLEDQGFQDVKSLKQNGKPLKFKVEETILEVDLNSPIAPGKKAVFEMDFLAQVPIQIRRSGRNSAEGIDYSMTQWYPKMAEYDREGWHPNPYIAREFYGIWGDFDVKITLDSQYTVAATGYLQNANSIGKGYEEKGSLVKRTEGKNLTWLFKAPNVHDFAWAADPDYLHDVAVGPKGLKIHFFYQNDPQFNQAWKDVQPSAVKLFEIMNSRFGEYPYMTYSIIQGGDGGMEYPMATLITGKRNLASLTGVAVHEVIHSWYQMLLATNESKYPWMDEGFTTFAGDVVMDELQKKNSSNPWEGSYNGYFALVKSGDQEPLTTHADHYATNRAYGISSYSMGAVFLAQLGYVIGDDALFIALKNYFNKWKFRHPTPNDFLVEAEKASGMVLDWYLEYWTASTKTIDYKFRNISGSGKSTQIIIDRVGDFPMPIDVAVKLKSGRLVNYYIPLELMRGEKPESGIYDQTILLDDWNWVYPSYQFSIDIPLEEIEAIEIDPTGRMADVDPLNNSYPYQSNLVKVGKNK